MVAVVSVDPEAAGTRTFMLVLSEKMCYYINTKNNFRFGGIYGLFAYF